MNLRMSSEQACAESDVTESNAHCSTETNIDNGWACDWWHYTRVQNYYLKFVLERKQNYQWDYITQKKSYQLKTTECY